MGKMNRTQREEKCDALNQAMLQWKAMESTGQDYSTWRNKVFILAFELFDGQQDPGTGKEDDPNAFLNAFDEACKTFDVGKSTPFSGYLGYLNNKRQIDAHRAREHHAPAALSLDAPVSNSDEQEGSSQITLGEISPDVRRGESAAEKYAVLSEAMLKLTAMTLNFWQHHTGKSANEAKRHWYRLFFTEDITLVAKEGVLLTNQAEVFQTIEEPYLTYYMTAPCHSMQEIERTLLKTYGEVVMDADDEDRYEQTPVPLPADVSLNYLEHICGIKAGRSTRSNQLKAYKEEREALLC